MNKKQSVAKARLQSMPSNMGFTFNRPLYQLSYFGTEGDGFIADIWNIYNYKWEVICKYNMYWYVHERYDL